MRSTIKHSIIIGFLAILGLCPEGMAQQRPVYVTASLIDKNKLFIEDLEKEEVQLFENGSPRTIEFLAQEELPTVYGILIDRKMLGAFLDNEGRRGTSFSRTPQARSFVYGLIDKFLGRHALWVGYYEQKLEVVLDYTLDGQRAKEAIQRMRGRRNPEESFLFAALMSAVQKMNGHNEKRRVLIVILNTLDPQSAGKMKPLKNLLSGSNVELFLVSFGSRMRSSRYQMTPFMSQAALRELGNTTAGASFFTTSFGDHPEDLTRRLINHMRTFYTFGFESTSAADQSGELRIRCSRKGSKVKAHPLVPLP
jgi:VWFA-related protein